MEKRIFFGILLLLLVLSSFEVLRAQGNSYIIVHAVNPEGVEIASIEGVGGCRVQIYDGDDLIGCGIYSEEDCSRPIAISPGAHTIRVVFNGILKQQDVDLQAGETKHVTFVFNRTKGELSDDLLGYRETGTCPDDHPIENHHYGTAVLTPSNPNFDLWYWQIEQEFSVNNAQVYYRLPGDWQWYQIFEGVLHNPSEYQLGISQTNAYAYPWVIPGGFAPPVSCTFLDQWVNVMELHISSVPYDILGTGVQCGGGGGEPPPECAFSAENPVWIDEADKMILPYDEVWLEFMFTNTASNPVTNVRVEFIDTDLIDFLIDTEQKGSVAANDNFTVINMIRIAGTDNADIMNEIINIGGSGKLSLEGEMEVWVTADQCSEPCVFTQLVPVDEKNSVQHVQYPDFMTNSPEVTDPPGDIDDYYNKGGGDSDFHHPDDVDVRKQAVEVSLDSSWVFPDDVSNVAYNIYNHIKIRFGDQFGLKYVDNDIDITKRNLWDTQVCITQAYFLSSLARTVGIPAREVMMQLGPFRDKEKEGKIAFRSHLAAHLWYDGRWHLYDAMFDKFDQRNVCGYVGIPIGPNEETYAECLAYYSSDRRFDHAYSTRYGPDLFGHKWKVNAGEESKFGWTFWDACGKAGLLIWPESPIRICLVDAEGKQTGFVFGGIAEEIPDSYYVAPGYRIYTYSSDPEPFVEAKEMIYVAEKVDAADYSLVVTGTGNGSYGIILAYMDKDGNIYEQAALSFAIRLDETHTYDLTLLPSGEISITSVPADIDIDPDVINLDASGQWVTCYIELPYGFDVSDIYVYSLRLNESVAALLKPVEISDYDFDGLPDLMVKFDRQQVINILELGEQTIEVSGRLNDGTLFYGMDIIRVIDLD